MNKMSQIGVKKQHEPHQKLGMISDATEGEADPAPNVAHVVLLMLFQSR